MLSVNDNDVDISFVFVCFVIKRDSQANLARYASQSIVGIMYVTIKLGRVYYVVSTNLSFLFNIYRRGIISVTLYLFGSA